MFETLKIFELSSAMAKHSARRQAIVAENMANADTPGYHAKRLASFADSHESVVGEGFTLRRSRAGHIAPAPHEVVRFKLENDSANPALDGNSVSVEKEMIESVNVKREHDRALTIYKSALKILHSTLARS